MELVEKPVKTLYFKYLVTAFGSALVGAVYTLVDMAVIGQYEGPNGTAAIALILPVWSIICSLGILTGIGGSVIYSTAKGEARQGSTKKANAIFTASFICTAALALVMWAFVFFFDDTLLTMLGSSGELFELGIRYLTPLKYAVPFFVFSQMLAAFLRNDNDPALATFAVICTAILNIIGDYFFTFTLDMGIFGAALATAICSVLSVFIMLTHFLKNNNTLKFEKPLALLTDARRIVVTGFSTFFVDISMGFMTMLYNHQIIHYLNTDALSVFGAIASLCAIVQCCSYSIGQAAQPILSANFGANQCDRLKSVLKYGIATAVVFGMFWVAVTMLLPNTIIHVFMSPTDSVLEIAPDIMRRYGIAFLFAPFTVFATYYFQSLSKPAVSFGVSVSRGLVVGGILVFALPAIFGANAIWFAMPIAELLVAFVTIILIVRHTKMLDY